MADNQENKQVQLELDLLLREYDHAKKEIAFYMELFNKHDVFINIVYAMIAAIISFLEPQKYFLQGYGYSQFLGVVFLLFIFFVLTYFFVYVLSALYYIILNSSKITCIEKRINEIVGKPVLIWENRVMPHIHNVKGFAKGGILNINYIKGILTLFLYILVQALISGILLDVSQKAGIIYIVLAITVFLVICFQWIVYLSSLPKVLANIIELAYQPNVVNISPSDSPIISKTRSILVILLTICFGFLPMCVSTLVYGSFTFSGSSDLPLLAYTSVLIGDLILLPYFNAVFLDAAILLREKIKNNRIKRIVIKICLTCSVLISVAINIYTHFFLWSQDTITSFMDNLSGELTMPGYIHLVFSTIQTAIILAFLFLAFFMLSPKIKTVFSRHLKKLSLTLLLFSLLSIPDFCIRNLCVLKTSFTVAIETDFPSLLIFPVMLIIFLVIHIKNKQKMTDAS